MPTRWCIMPVTRAPMPKDTTPSPIASTQCGDYGEDVGGRLTGSDRVDTPDRETELPAVEFSRRREIVHVPQVPPSNCGRGRPPQVPTILLGPTPRTETQQRRDSPAVVELQWRGRVCQGDRVGHNKVRNIVRDDRNRLGHERRGRRSTTTPIQASRRQ